MPEHCFNILTFNHPSDQLAFYFTNNEQENVTRIYHSLVPKEVSDEHGEQEHYYTSFNMKMEGFIPATKLTTSREIPDDGKDNLWLL